MSSKPLKEKIKGNVKVIFRVLFPMKKHGQLPSRDIVFYPYGRPQRVNDRGY